MSKKSTITSSHVTLFEKKIFFHTAMSVSTEKVNVMVIPLWPHLWGHNKRWGRGGRIWKTVSIPMAMPLNNQIDIVCHSLIPKSDPHLI